MTLKYDIPASFFEQEVRNDYTVTAEMKRVWAVQLDLLQELLRVCQAHGLRVFADSGTLIGAVRHQGFIPWDDDIDMTMLREDYDKLMALASEFREPYFLQTITTDEDYGNRHAQLRMSGTKAIPRGGRRRRCHQGIFIDIFVLDAMPRSPRAFKHHYARIAKAKLRLKVVSKLLARLPFPVYRWCRYHTRALSDRELFRRYEDVLRSVPQTSRTNVGALICINMSVPIKSLSNYDEVRWLPFEHIQIPIPSGYDELLRMEYGDYMTPVQAPTLHGGMLFET